MVITQALISEIRQQFALDWHGIHGAAHWVRVRANGLRLASNTQARTDVVELFSFLHDSMREDDYRDPDHGTRASDYAASLQGKLFDLDDEGLSLLRVACEGHSNGYIEADVTVQTCWDADRLDLGRVGIRPDPNRLCTSAARESDMLVWAYNRSIKGRWAPSY